MKIIERMLVGIIVLLPATWATYGIWLTYATWSVGQIERECFRYVRPCSVCAPKGSR